MEIESEKLQRASQREVTKRDFSIASRREGNIIENGGLFTAVVSQVNLTSEQLKKELRKADIQYGLSRLFAENDEEHYWKGFKEACQLALDIQKSRRPKIEVREGQFSVRAIKEAHDIVDVIGRYTDLRKAGKEYVGRCPFHRDNHPSLQVNQEKQVFYCFSCQRKGDWINFIMQIENLSTKGACLFLGE